MKQFKAVKSPAIIIAAFLFTVGLLAVGYVSFGIVTTIVFASGFLTGFILWLFMPMIASFQSIKTPYWLSFAAFVLLHRVEEYVFKFQEELSKITGNPVPDISSPSLIILVIASVGGWLFVPLLMKRRHPFGYYLAWTFFSAMGITELAHFIFPFFTDNPYSYFPGMASVIVLAPPAWWGMRRLSKNNCQVTSTLPANLRDSVR